MKDSSKIIGHITVYSGVLLLTDGVTAQQLPVPQEQRVIFDTEKENIKVPVIASQQGGRRFLIIPLDDVEDIAPAQGQVVEVQDPVTVPAEKKSDDKEDE